LAGTNGRMESKALRPLLVSIQENPKIEALPQRSGKSLKQRKDSSYLRSGTTKHVPSVGFDIVDNPKIKAFKQRLSKRAGQSDVSTFVGGVDSDTESDTTGSSSSSSSSSDESSIPEVSNFLAYLGGDSSSKVDDCGISVRGKLDATTNASAEENDNSGDEHSDIPSKDDGVASSFCHTIDASTKESAEESDSDGNEDCEEESDRWEDEDSGTIDETSAYRTLSTTESEGVAETNVANGDDSYSSDGSDMENSSYSTGSDSDNETDQEATEDGQPQSGLIRVYKRKRLLDIIPSEKMVPFRTNNPLYSCTDVIPRYYGLAQVAHNALTSCMAGAAFQRGTGFSAKRVRYHQVQYNIVDKIITKSSIVVGKEDYGLTLRLAASCDTGSCLGYRVSDMGSLYSRLHLDFDTVGECTLRDQLAKRLGGLELIPSPDSKTKLWTFSGRYVALKFYLLSMVIGLGTCDFFAGLHRDSVHLVQAGLKTKALKDDRKKHNIRRKDRERIVAEQILEERRKLLLQNQFTIISMEEDGVLAGIIRDANGRPIGEPKNVPYMYVCLRKAPIEDDNFYLAIPDTPYIDKLNADGRGPKKSDGDKFPNKVLYIKPSELFGHTT